MSDNKHWHIPDLPTSNDYNHHADLSNMELPKDFHTTNDSILETVQEHFEESKKNEKRNFIIMILTLVVSTATLIATIIALLR